MIDGKLHLLHRLSNNSTCIIMMASGRQIAHSPYADYNTDSRCMGTGSRPLYRCDHLGGYPGKCKTRLSEISRVISSKVLLCKRSLFSGQKNHGNSSL